MPIVTCDYATMGKAGVTLPLFFYPQNKGLATMRYCEYVNNVTRTIRSQHPDKAISDFETGFIAASWIRKMGVGECALCILEIRESGREAIQSLA